MVEEKLAQRVPKVRDENGEEDPLKRGAKIWPLGQFSWLVIGEPARPGWPGHHGRPGN